MRKSAEGRGARSGTNHQQIGVWIVGYKKVRAEWSNVEVGGLMSYAADLNDLFRRARQTGSL